MHCLMVTEGTIFVEKTPFYATSGGQQADTGVIRTADGEFQVEDVNETSGRQDRLMSDMLTKGMVKVGDTVTLVRLTKRSVHCLARNHSATHLLQKALRNVLGNHVEQAGSYVDAAQTAFRLYTFFSDDTRGTGESRRDCQ